MPRSNHAVHPDYSYYYIIFCLFLAVHACQSFLVVCCCFWLAFSFLLATTFLTIKSWFKV